VPATSWNETQVILDTAVQKLLGFTDTNMLQLPFLTVSRKKDLLYLAPMFYREHWSFLAKEFCGIFAQEMFTYPKPTQT